MTTAVEHIYRYQTASQIHSDSGAETNRLVLSADRPFSFLCQLPNPALCADVLLCLSEIIRANFVRPNLQLLDPVVTCAPDGVRFEGFSGCGGIYVSAKFPLAADSLSDSQFGTTNVDFNDEFRNGLARLRHGNQLSLTVTQDHVRVAGSKQELIEKKVKLPLRWLRGFCEVQAIAETIEPAYEVPTRTIGKLLQDLPRDAAGSKPLWVVASGKSLRVTSRQSAKAVPIVGTERLRLLQPLLKRHAGSCVVGKAPHQECSAWQLDLGQAQFTLILSAGLYRGFSGEGQVLDQLASETWQNAIDQVRNQLSWDQPLDRGQLRAKLGLASDEIDRALAALATRGVVGYDLFLHEYFFRQLPFRSDLVETMQPRLVAAKALIADRRIAPSGAADKPNVWHVQGTDVQHTVELHEDGPKCTCVWFNRHQNERGPCKHILAALILAESEL